MVGEPMLTEAVEDAAVADAAPEPAPETIVLPANAPAAPPAARIVSSTHFLCDLETLTVGVELRPGFLRVIVTSLTGWRRLTDASGASAVPGDRAATGR